MVQLAPLHQSSCSQGKICSPPGGSLWQPNSPRAHSFARLQVVPPLRLSCSFNRSLVNKDPISGPVLVDKPPDMHSIKCLYLACGLSAEHPVSHLSLAIHNLGDLAHVLSLSVHHSVCAGRERVWVSCSGQCGLLSPLGLMSGCDWLNLGSYLQQLRLITPIPGVPKVPSSCPRSC